MPERLLGLRRHVVDPQRARELDRAPHLFDVCGAAVAGREVRVETLALTGGQIALEVRGDELDELATVQMGQTDAHASSDKYCSSARLTLARPRSIPFRTATQVSWTTSSASAAVGTNMRATRRSDGFRLRINSMKASSSPARSRSTSFASCSERSCDTDRL